MHLREIAARHGQPVKHGGTYVTHEKIADPRHPHHPGAVLVLLPPGQLGRVRVHTPDKADMVAPFEE